MATDTSAHETGGGASGVPGAPTLPYRWTQTLAAVDVNVPTAPGTRARDIGVDIKRTHLKISVHGALIAEVRAQLTGANYPAQSGQTNAHGRSMRTMDC